jgi:hypothetical protein
VENNEIMPVRGGFVNPNEAKVNLTWANQNYDLSNPVLFDMPEEDLKGMLAEIIRAGGDGIPADADIGPMAHFVVSRHEPTETRPHRMIMVRPKTSFGQLAG